MTRGAWFSIRMFNASPLNAPHHTWCRTQFPPRAWSGPENCQGGTGALETLLRKGHGGGQELEVIEFYRVEKCRGFAGCIGPTELKRYNLFAEVMHLHRFHSLRFVLCSVADNPKLNASTPYHSRFSGTR